MHLSNAGSGTTADGKMGKMGSLRCLKLEERDLGSHVEADLSEVSDAAADVQPTVALQFEDSRGVSAILDGQQGRRKKRWLALAAVCVAGEDPTFERPPARFVHGIWIVAQDERGSIALDGGQCANVIETLGPQVVHAGDLKASDLSDLVAKDVDALSAEKACESRRDLRMRPVRAVVVVPEYPDGPQPATRSVSIQALRMREDVLVIAREVACVDDEIRREGH